MIKVENNVASREPVPDFLDGLAPESLADLSWTDPALGVSGAAWWPEVDESPALAAFERYGDETLTPDAVGRRVVVTRAVVPWQPAEIAQAQAEAAAALQAAIVADTQQRLDDFARTRNYDGILSACTYAASAVPKFAAEGQYAVQARDATWAALYAVMADVLAGNRPAPTGFADIEDDLPELVWPA